MILPEQELLIIGDIQEKIIRFETWFQTPRGLVGKLADAVTIFKELDMPVEGIRYVSVAIGEGQLYEVVS